MKKRGRIVAFFLIVLLLLGLVGTTVTGVAKKINLGLDLQGGFEVLYEVEPLDEDEDVTRKLLESTVDILNDRVDSLGISEASIDIEGEDRIRVQLAGVEDQEEARDMLETSARLSFRDVNDKKLLDGSDIKEGSAKQDFDGETGEPIVTVTLKDASEFADVTRQIKDMGPPDNRLVIWMDYDDDDSFEEEVDKDDPAYESAPSVGKVINSPDVQIEGYDVDEAKDIASVINAGSLPVDMDELYSDSVGAQFGEKSLDKTVTAGVIGVSLVLLFMMVMYRFPGFIAAINLVVYVYLILIVFDLMNGVLTLPGIAALILGVGMAVDANVITFERIKEELREGKSVLAAFRAGTSNSLRAIIDANITTILAAAVLFIFGTSSVRGFATMLIISILVSFITAVYGTRLLMQLWVKTSFLRKRVSWFGVKKKDIKDINDSTVTEPTLFNRPLNVIGHRRKFFFASSALIILGIISIGIFKLNPGIDFTSGSRVEVLGDETITTEEIEDGLDDLDLEAKSVVISGDDNDTAVIRYDRVIDEDNVDELKSYFDDKYGNEPNVSVVSPIVGEELVKNALYALLWASIGMIIYVAFRFEFFFAVTAIIALIHDAFFMVAIFSFTRLEFDVNIVAAILTIIGYSINDTIVTFDRIRENIQRERKRIKSFKELAKIVNRSLIQTMTRSINTTVTTLIAVLAFLFLGAESIRGFAIALAIGLIAGTYSSLFLASQLWLVWRGKRIKKKPVSFIKKKKTDGPQV